APWACPSPRSRPAAPARPPSPPPWAARPWTGSVPTATARTLRTSTSGYPRWPSGPPWPPGWSCGSLRSRSGQHGQRASDAGEGGHRPLDVVGGVGGRELDADARLSPGHHRVEEPLDVDALLEQRAGEPLGQGRVLGGE